MSSSGRGSTSPITWRGSLTDLAVAMSARNGPVMVTLSLSGILLSRLRMILWVLLDLADADAVDRQPRRELAGEVAVEADDHRLEAQVAAAR